MTASTSCASVAAAEIHFIAPSFPFGTARTAIIPRIGRKVIQVRTPIPRNCRSMGENPLLETQSFKPKEKDGDSEKDKDNICLDPSRLNPTCHQSEKPCKVRHKVDHSIHDAVIKTPCADKKEEVHQAADTEAQDDGTCPAPEARIRNPQALTRDPRNVSGNGRGNNHVENRRKRSFLPISPGPQRYCSGPAGGPVDDSVNDRVVEPSEGPRHQQRSFYRGCVVKLVEIPLVDEELVEETQLSGDRIGVDSFPIVGRKGDQNSKARHSERQEHGRGVRMVECLLKLLDPGRRDAGGNDRRRTADRFEEPAVCCIEWIETVEGKERKDRKHNERNRHHEGRFMN